MAKNNSAFEQIWLFSILPRNLNKFFYLFKENLTQLSLLSVGIFVGLFWSHDKRSWKKFHNGKLFAAQSSIFVYIVSNVVRDTPRSEVETTHLFCIGKKSTQLWKSKMLYIFVWASMFDGTLFPGSQVPNCNWQIFMNAST